LESLVQDSFISRDGAEWLKAAMDPFHDTDIELKGFPDVNVAPSVVQLIKVTQSISVPTTVTTGTWDCNIFTLPWVTPENMNSAVKDNSVISPTTPLSLQLGGVSHISVQSGTSTATPLTAAVEGDPLTIPATYLDGSSRVIGYGVEIVNTTSDLNRQGLVIVYRMPQPPMNGQTYTLVNTGDTAVVGAISLSPVRKWPTSAANAMLLTGSRQWEAAEGAYLVSTLNSINLPAQAASYVAPIILQDEAEGSQDDIAVTMITPIASSGGYAYSMPPLSLQPYNMSGAYFTGLSLQTTLQVSLNVYIERFPSFDELDLVPLAKPSPGFNARTLELYSTALCDLPPGVMAKENGLGSWFMDTVGKVASFAAPVLKSIPLPMTQMLGTAVGAFSSKRLTRRPAYEEESYDEEDEPAQSYAAPPSAIVQPRQPRRFLPRDDYPRQPQRAQGGKRRKQKKRKQRRRR